MDVHEVIDRFRDSYSVKRVYGEPIVQGQATLVPAARVRGGGGGGGGEGPQGQGSGSGSGFGVDATPVGAFVLRGDEVRWRPAVDLNRLLLGAQLLLGLGLWTVGRVLVARRRGQPPRWRLGPLRCC
jgi:uncharacterized spore protein YtfJ